MAGHNKVYGVCENKCFVEVLPKKDAAIRPRYDLIVSDLIVGEAGYTDLIIGHPTFPDYSLYRLVEYYMRDGVFELRISSYKDKTGDDEVSIIEPYDHDRFGIVHDDDGGVMLRIFNRSENWIRKYKVYEVV